MTYPNCDPRDLYGQDLITVFGPKNQRVHIGTLNSAQKNKILELVPETLETDDLGDRPSLYQVANKILNVMAQSKAFIGVDLDWQPEHINGLGLDRPDDVYRNAELVYKNNKTQRGIKMKHLVENLLFSWNNKAYLTGLARQLPDGTFNLNDAQHRNVSAIILGIRWLPIDVEISSFESVDVDQYAYVNLLSLSASPYDHFRIRVQRNLARKAEGRPLDPEDIQCEDIYNIHKKHNSYFVEKGVERIYHLQCSSVANMQKYYENYGPKIYEYALGIVCRVWNKSALSTANCWGLMEFISEQLKSEKPDNINAWLFNIQRCIAARYSDSARSGMHLDIKRVFDTHPVAGELDIPERIKIASGIYKICITHDPNNNWKPIMWNGRDLCNDFLDGFKVMMPKTEQNANQVVGG
jgi:hypothetical protein